MTRTISIIIFMLVATYLTYQWVNIITAIIWKAMQ